MFAYCLNNPVNMVDNAGKMGQIINAILELADDLIRVFGDGDEALQIIKSKSNVKIQNSSLVDNPLIILGYSTYLKYFSDCKDFFDGSVLGIAYEWKLHNLAYDSALIAEDFGIDTIELQRKAKDVDLGPTIFYDNHGKFSFIMEFAFSVSFPRIAIRDALATILGGD